KLVSVWRAFGDEDLDYRPHPRSSTVLDVLKHELLSERRFFGEFLGSPEPAAPEVLPVDRTVDAYVRRIVELARPRLDYLAPRDEAWWLEPVDFFDVRRERIWI